MRLKRDFFLQPTLKLAQEFLGKVLVRRIGAKFIAGIITETEAYIGPYDKASHSYQNRLTSRNLVEYFLGGFCYIYLVYGLHWQFNITTFLANKPECILIRALKPLRPLKVFSLNPNGPGKVCSFLKLNGNFYGEDLVFSNRLWMEDLKIKIPPSQIKRKSRVGIDYAGPYYAQIKWRFLVENF